MVNIKRIGQKNKSDINIANETFPIYGKMVPSYINEQWTYTIKHFNKYEAYEMTFPDTNYSYDELYQNSFFVGAYLGDDCIGLAIYQKSWNKYLYLYDLKVNLKARGCGIGRMLIEEGKSIAKENGYKGIYTQGQDNNLNACLFYVKSGFKIGGLDTMVYCGTKQEGKSDIIFYLNI